MAQPTEAECGFDDNWDRTKQYQYWFATWNNPTQPYDLDLKVDAYWSSKKVAYARGQLEKGENGTVHWQFIVYFLKKDRTRLVAMKKLFGDKIHWRPCKSEKAEAYVWKDETAQGHRFEWGKRPFKNNSKLDHDKAFELCKQGRIEELPASYLMYHYATAKKIKMDYMQADPIEKTIQVYHGPTKMGKSRRAWAEAGWDAYPKTPTTKFWDGYQGQGNVVIDEFTGQIEISHLLRWLDRYPVLVETKGSGTPLKASKIWITSNVSPENWYLTAPQLQIEALLRRLQIHHMTEPWIPNLLDLPKEQEEPQLDN